LLDIIAAAGVDDDSRDVFAMIEEDLREAGSSSWGRVKMTLAVCRQKIHYVDSDLQRGGICQ